MRDQYLDLLRDALTFSLWPEPPRPVTLTARRDAVAWLARAADAVAARFGVRLCVEKQIERDVCREWPLLAHTMVGRRRLDNIRELCAAVERDGVPGSWVECGVWRGGASIYARACLPSSRLVVCCDSFCGLPFDAAEPDFYEFDFLRVSRDQVRENFRRFGLLNNVLLIRGYFQDTLELVRAPIAILRADGDMFSSTIQILSELYERVSPGGFIIIDDWWLPPCRQAVEFFRDYHRITAPIQPIDGFGVYWRKA